VSGAGGTNETRSNDQTEFLITDYANILYRLQKRQRGGGTSEPGVNGGRRGMYSRL